MTVINETATSLFKKPTCPKLVMQSVFDFLKFPTC